MKNKIEFIEWHAPWTWSWGLAWFFAYHAAPDKSNATLITLGFQWLVTY